MLNKAILGLLLIHLCYSLPETEKKPTFCKKLDCPKFTVLKQTKEYQLRQYVSTNWVSTDLLGIDYKSALNKMFMKLFRYIQGANIKGEKIPMTVPVTTRIIPGQGPACKNNFTMSFYLPHPAPAPTDTTVKLTKLPPLKAYVRSFGGYIMSDFKPWALQAQELADAINSTASYHTDFYFTGGYDSPFTFLFRHNEIWFIAK